VGEVDVEVAHALVVVGDRRERAVHAGTPRAELRAELQEGGDFAESVGAETVRFDDLVRDVAAGVGLTPVQEDTECHRRREERGEGDEGADEVHSRSG
jgi:hypothetical protein